MSKGEITKGFRICDRKGFHITFKNGTTVSVQFGYGNYSEIIDEYSPMEYLERLSSNKYESEESDDAEVAIWNKEDKWITKEYKDTDDSVMGYVTPEEVLKILNWAYEYDKKSEEVK